MPNWCYSNVDIHAEKEKLDILEREFNAALSANPLKADFGNMWLGNLLLHIGMSEDEAKHGTIRCRGELFDVIRTDDTTLMLRTYSAWSPHLQCICEFVNHYAEDAEIIYTSEEPGCELYWTNDPEVVETVYIDYYTDEDIPDEFVKILGYQDRQKDELVKCLQNIFGTDETSLDEFQKKINARIGDSDNYICLHAYEYVDIADTD